VCAFQDRLVVVTGSKGGKSLSYRQKNADLDEWVPGQNKGARAREFRVIWNIPVRWRIELAS
jgi:hypothetical protein